MSSWKGRVSQLDSSAGKVKLGWTWWLLFKMIVAPGLVQRNSSPRCPGVQVKLRFGLRFSSSSLPRPCPTFFRKYVETRFYAASQSPCEPTQAALRAFAHKTCTGDLRSFRLVVRRFSPFLGKFVCLSVPAMHEDDSFQDDYLTSNASCF